MESLGCYIVGIIGSTGAVGVEVVKCLEKRQFPVTELHLYSSAKSSGRCVETAFGNITIKEYSLEDARMCDIIFLAVSGEFALANAKALTDNNGPFVIDNSSAFRYDSDIPLVVRTFEQHLYILQLCYFINTMGFVY